VSHWGNARRLLPVPVVGAMIRREAMKSHHQLLRPLDFDNVAGNGLVDRRLFLTSSAVAAVAASGVAFPDPATADPLAVESWMKVPGSPFVGYGQSSQFEDKVVRLAACS